MKFFRLHQIRVLTLVNVLLLSQAVPGNPIRAEIPTELEPDYSEAVLAFNAKNYDRALALLNELLKKNPQIIELMELKALTLKNTHQSAESASIYSQLIDVKKREARPEKEFAPYAFELGMIHYREKKTELAQQEFELAIRNDFNSAVSHLYLGMLTFQRGNFSSAATHFEGALHGEAADIRPVVHFYLAQAHVKTGYPTGATHHLIAARDSARTIVEGENFLPESKKIAQQILEGSQKALAPFDKGQWFANLTLLSGFDNNVMFLPSSLATSTDISKKQSIKSTLMWSGGYASSPLRRWQWVPSLRGNLTRNFNEDARGFEFVSNTASLYLNHQPLSKTTYGFKGDFTLLFKNNYSATEPKTVYQAYNHVISVGPYVRREIFKKTLGGVELFYQPQKFYQDGTGNDTRTGNDFLGRVFIQNDEGRKFFNPQASFRYDLNRTQGKNFRSSTVGFTVGNLMHVWQKLDLSLAIDYSLISFKERTPETRNDQLLVVSLTSTYKLSSHWILMISADTTQNQSNLADTYRFSRFSGQAGLSYVF